MKDKSHKRHIAKTITWRIVGTLDTILLAWLISGNAFTGLKIGFAEVITKMILYYFHERFWFKGEFSISSGKWSSRRRHIAKTISWRIVGTMDTMLLAWIITGNPITGFKIGLAEVITKMILYYLHERTWYRVDYGLPGRRDKAEEVVEVKEQVKG
ncbi:DUF2061 domain-containing protein [Salinimicrobium xinjiangense]|uniref:DUF2061 domain-containing protein n=1 Tax=Salinimicrobium xinjiangense TaxID=438596 RepID=UPI00041EA764|nr:DUF2061 domain-containing protein [Salinimicrobium xinjiangense]